MDGLHTALKAPLDEDLLPLSVLLHQRGVRHRISEHEGHQVLEVTRAEQVAEVAALYQSWRDGELQIELGRRSRGGAGRPPVQLWSVAPVTLALIALSVIGFLLVYVFQSQAAIAWLTFLPFTIDGTQLRFEAMGREYWRLITPVFLHFGWLHIAFNSLWLWDLGRRIEAVMGSFNMLMLCLVVALVSNTCQHLFGGPGLFGGMSGVVYGLLGFAWVGPLLQPAWPIQPPPAIMLLMVGWLVVCLFGLVEALGFGSIANAAHVGGLLCGAALGAIFGFRSRLTDTDD